MFNVRKLFPVLLIVSTCSFVIFVHVNNISRIPHRPTRYTSQTSADKDLPLDNTHVRINNNDVLEFLEKLPDETTSDINQVQHARKSLDININVNVTINDLSEALATIIQEIKQMNNGLDKKTEPKSPIEKDIVKNGIFPGVPSKIYRDDSECLLTLFTTWDKSHTDSVVHRNTLHNWARFKPIVRPVLLFEDRKSFRQALNAGWDILPIQKKAKNGLPILKDMFEDVRRTFRSKFYGFANADILFTNSLINTLTSVGFDNSLNQSLTFITGIRTNVINMTVEEAATGANIIKAANERGTVFTSSAEDYFITGSGYPWSDIPELVVGSLAYDNWLVLSARAKRHHVIDGTGTIPAVHQSLSKGDFYQSHFRESANYNAQLLKDLLYDISPPYHRGFTECTELYTYFQDGQVLIKRREIPDYCKP